MKILLVEDEPILADVLREKLQENKYTVDLATDGEAALEHARRFYPDIIILDLILPKKDGFEVLNELKSDIKLKNIPVVVLSNLGQDEEIKRALSLGAADYMVKTQHPINEIVEKIKKYSLIAK